MLPVCAYLCLCVCLTSDVFMTQDSAAVSRQPSQTALRTKCHSVISHSAVEMSCQLAPLLVSRASVVLILRWVKRRHYFDKFTTRCVCVSEALRQRHLTSRWRRSTTWWCWLPWRRWLRHHAWRRYRWPLTQFDDNRVTSQSGKHEHTHPSHRVYIILHAHEVTHLLFESYPTSLFTYLVRPTSKR